MLDELHATVAARLRSADQRYTASRRALVELLAGQGRPVSIPDILTVDPRLPQSSVYRNLAVLEHAGTVRRVLAADEFARYELAEDLTAHHHHLVCESCGSVDDVTLPARLERTVDRAIEELANSTGFDVHGHRLDLIGRCARCTAAERRTRRRASHR
jgi:Fur family transcriptional regulator, ferric uptake regulator